MFTKNRERLRTTGMSRKVIAAILAQPEVKPLLSDAHFPVDGTLIKAWASIKSFQSKAPSEDDEVDSRPPTDPPPPKPDQPETPEPPPMQSKSRNAAVDFRGQKRSNALHADGRAERKAALDRVHRHFWQF